MALATTDMPGHQQLGERATAALERCEERPDVDFKESSAWSQLRGKIIRTALGMANLRDGGLVIVGVSERGSTWDPTGVTPDHRATYEKVDEILDEVNTFASPHVEVGIVLHAWNECEFIVFDVREFDDTPIVCAVAWEKRSSRTSSVPTWWVERAWTTHAPPAGGATMRRAYDSSDAIHHHLEAGAEVCSYCGGTLWKCQQRPRFVQRLDGVHLLIRYDKSCHDETCEGRHIIYRPFEDLRFALPHANYGFDVVLEIGERHLLTGQPFAQIQRDLNRRGVPISAKQTGSLFRVYVTLSKLCRGSEEELVERLNAQGGIVLMVDGVQYDDKSPVLYLVWDAISGEPLFGERKPFRSEADLVPLLEKVKAMGIRVLGMVTDKEKGLVPALKKVFPKVPYQYCQIHFLKNCALALADDLHAVSESINRRARRVQALAKRLHERGVDSVESEHHDAHILPETLDEEEFVAELCAMVRHASRASGRAPLNPPELVRHQRLEEIREFAHRAAKKGGACTSSSPRP